jgi:hypothetical protein
MHNRLDPYWVEMPGRATFVYLGTYNHLHTLLLQPNSKSEIDVAAMHARILQAMQDGKVEERIRDQIAKNVGKALEGVTVFGFGLGGLASGVASATTSVVMKFIEWLLDDVLATDNLAPIVVTHKTARPNVGPPSSTVTYAKPAADGTLAPISHKYLLKRNLLPHHAPDEQGASEYGEREAIEWSHESTMPRTGALPFRMVNTRRSAVFWPATQQHGAHLFLPFTKSTGDAVYVLAVRTEVRLAPVTFQTD